MNNFFRKIIPYLIAATFIMPLIVGNNYIFPFIVPKILFFRSLVLVILGVYAVLLISDFKTFKPHFSWLSVSIVLFWISFVISTFAGVDWYHSFWDNHERMLGLFTITHYVILYFVASAALRSEHDWSLMFRAMLLFGSAVMCVGIWQRFINPQALLNGGSERVSATLGNPIYYSGYGLFLMFTGLLSYIREKNKIWKWLTLVCSVLGFIGIFLGGTRGTLLGLVAGCGVLAVCYGFLSPEKSRGSQILKYASIAALALIIVLFFFRKTEFVSNIPGLGRLFSTSFSIINSTETRPMAWKVAINAWKEKPVFGWGPNNFYYAFNKYYDPKFLAHGWNETWFDNAHSVIFNTLVVQGSFGLLVYISIYGVASTLLYIEVRRSKISQHLGFVSIAFLIAHLVGLVTVFENPTSYLYFFIFAAFVLYSTRAVGQKKEKMVEGEAGSVLVKQKKILPRNVSLGGIVCVGLSVFCIIYITDIAPARANKATITAIQKIYTGTADAHIYEEALAYASPHLDDIRNDVSRTVFGALPGMVQQKKNDQVTGLFNATVQELQKNQLLHPLDVRVHFTLSQIFEFGYQATQKKEFLSESEVALRRALLLSPKRQQIIYSLAQNLAEQGKFKEAEEILKQSIEDYGQIGEGWVRLALIYASENKIKEAKEVATQVLGWYENPTANIYQLDQSWKTIIQQIVDVSSTKVST